MAQELELAEYATVDELQGSKANSGGTEQSDATSKERLLRIGMLTVGVLCIVLATVSISMRIAFHSKEDTDQFPFNSSITDMCQILESQQNSTQACSCYKEQARKLLTAYQRMQKERDFFRNKFNELNRDTTREDGDFLDSGSGNLEVRFMKEIDGLL